MFFCVCLFFFLVGKDNGLTCARTRDRNSVTKHGYMCEICSRRVFVRVHKAEKCVNSLKKKIVDYFSETRFVCAHNTIEIRNEILFKIYIYIKEHSFRETFHSYYKYCKQFSTSRFFFLLFNTIREVNPNKAIVYIIGIRIKKNKTTKKWKRRQ